MITFKINQTWKAPELAAKLDKAVAAGLRGAAEEMTNRTRMSLNRLTLGSPSAVGSPPNRQTSNLYRGITWVQDAAGTRVGVLKNVKYAAIQEFGRKITAKGRGMLPIPIHPLAKQRARMGRGPRSFPFLVLVRSRKGKLMLIKNVGGRNARAEIYYVLKKSVTIPARPYFYPQSRNMGTLNAMQFAFIQEAEAVFAR